MNGVVLFKELDLLQGNFYEFLEYLLVSLCSASACRIRISVGGMVIRLEDSGGIQVMVHYLFYKCYGPRFGCRIAICRTGSPRLDPDSGD